MVRKRTLIVVGAGIGGLVAATTLSRVGYRVVLMERAAKLEEVGAGIQLTPNATRTLRQLGVLESLRPYAVEPRELIVADGESGAEIVRGNLRQATEHFGSPWWLVSRADLQRALADAAANAMETEIEIGTELVDFAEHARGVTVATRKHAIFGEHIGAALIGADGLRSRVRARLHGDTPPRFHRLVAWRALIPANDLPPQYSEPDVRLWFGRMAHIVHYPVSGGEQINVVAIFTDNWHGEDAANASISAIPKDCDTWTETPQTLLAAAKTFRRWALCDRPPLLTWGKGRVSLLGDAAHPMLPFLAQGAASAIEDAISLSRYLRNADNIPARLRSYEKERAQRTDQLQAAAIRTGRAYHARGFARLARNFVLHSLGGRRLIDSHGWIYQHEEKMPAGVTIEAI